MTRGMRVAKTSPELTKLFWLARLVWYPTAAMWFVILLAIIPAQFHTYQTDEVLGLAIDSGTRLAAIAGLLGYNIGSWLSLILAILLFRRRPDDRMALLVSYFLLLFGFQSGPIDALEPFMPGILAIQQSLPVTVLVSILALLLLALFPDGRFLPRWTRWCVALGLMVAAGAIPLDLVAAAEPAMTDLALTILNLVTTLLAMGLILGQVYRYRHYAGPIERQQLKWFIYGFSLQMVVNLIAWQPYIALQSLPEGSSLPPWALPVTLLWGLGTALVPTSLTVAVLRYRLYDIDIIIRRTLQYSLVTGILALVYYGAVVLFQSVFRAVTGQDSPLAVVLSTLIIAALFNPFRHRVQRFIDQRFYRSHYDARQTLGTFAAAARDQVEMDHLTRSLLQVVGETMQPEKASLWLAEGNQIQEGKHV